MPFGAHHKNLNEDRPILSVAKMTLVSGSIRFVQIFTEVPQAGGVKLSCSSGTLVSGHINSLCEYSWGFSRKETSNDSGVAHHAARAAVAC